MTHPLISFSRHLPTFVTVVFLQLWSPTVLAIGQQDVEDANLEQQIKAAQPSCQIPMSPESRSLQKTIELPSQWSLRYRTDKSGLKSQLALDNEIEELAEVGRYLSRIGQYESALNCFQKVLKLYKGTDNLKGQGTILFNMGWVHYSASDYQLSIETYQQALTIQIALQDHGFYGKAYTLGGLGLTYHALGDHHKAITYAEQALDIALDVNDRLVQFFSYADLGDYYHTLDQPQRALDFYQQSIDLNVTRDHPYQPYPYIGKGSAHYALQQYAEALASYQQGLDIAQIRDNPHSQVRALIGLGRTHQAIGTLANSMDHYQRALSIARTIGDRQGEGIVLTLLGQVFAEQNQPELAISFYKKSVEVRENIRSNLQDLPQDLRKRFTNTIADDYRALADLLLRANRVLEAQTVLDLLRTQELDDYLHDVRGTGATAAEINYWEAEEHILALYQEFLLAKDDLSLLRQKVKAQGFESLTSEELTLYEQLTARESDLIDSFEDFIEHPEVIEDVEALRTAKTGDIELHTLRTLQGSIANLDNAVLLYPLIFQDRLELILVPPDAPPIRRPVNASAQEINGVILDYRAVLRDPRQNPKPAAQKLYNWLIAPLEDDLALLNTQEGIQNIIYSPDGALRYIPLAALHDGNQWLAERFAISHITVESTSNFDTPPQTTTRLLAAACSECSFSPVVGETEYRFSDLPYTRIEVDNLAEQIPTADVLIDQAFSKPEIERRLASYNLIHLATHGAFVSDSPDNSFLLFGDGEIATLRDIRRWNLQDADLVVLSACETGLGSTELGNGIEVLGLGYQIQRAGAKAALASLWRVNDGGTQALMNAFYLAFGKGYSKAEALQRAQQALINDDLSFVGEPRATIQVLDTRTGEPVTLQGKSDHPYYWSPFILIGNGL